MAAKNIPFDKRGVFTRNAAGRALRKVSYGPNIVTDSVFATGAPVWSYNTSAWSVTGGQAVFNGSGVTGNHYIKQFLGDKVDVDAVYKLTFTVTAFSGSTPLVFMGSGNNMFAEVTGTGTYTLVNRFKKGDDLYIYFGGTGGSNSITIDNLHIQEVLFDQDDGVFELFEHPEGVPRIEYDYLGNRLGLLMEHPTTNLVPASDCKDWGISGATRVVNTETTLGAFTGAVVASAGGDWHRLQAGAVPVTSGDKYMVHFFFKYGTAGNVLCNLRIGSLESRVVGHKDRIYVQYTNAGALNNVREVQLPDGVRQITAEFVPNTTDNLFIGLGPKAINTGRDIIALGGMVETSLQPTSYVKTTGSQKTRNSDTWYLEATEFTSSYYGMTVYADVIHRNSVYNTGSHYGRLFALGALQMYNAGNQTGYVRYRAQDNSGTNVFIDNLSDMDTMLAGSKVAISVRNGVQNISKDGGTSEAGTGTDMDLSNSRLFVASEGAGTNVFNGHIKNLVIYPTALTAAQIEELTLPDDAATVSLSFDGQTDSYVRTYLHG